jgi:hypothetical protein
VSIFSIIHVYLGKQCKHKPGQGETMGQIHTQFALPCHTHDKERAMIDRLFLDHPRKVEESYLQHARFAFGFSAQLFAAAFAALVHALIPAFFERTASTIVARLYARTHHRGR